jgi:hypothetical protein
MKRPSEVVHHQKVKLQDNHKWLAKEGENENKEG